MLQNQSRYTTNTFKAFIMYRFTAISTRYFCTLVSFRFVCALYFWQYGYAVNSSAVVRTQRPMYRAGVPFSIAPLFQLFLFFIHFARAFTFMQTLIVPWLCIPAAHKYVFMWLCQSKALKIVYRLDLIRSLYQLFCASILPFFLPF